MTGSSLTIPRRGKHALYFQWLFTRTPFSRVVKNFRNRVIAETRQTYSEPLTIGEDRMSFEIGEMVTVKRYSGK